MIIIISSKNTIASMKSTIQLRVYNTEQYNSHSTMYQTEQISTYRLGLGVTNIGLGHYSHFDF